MAVRANERRLRSDLARPEARAGTVGRSAVVRHADDGDVEPVRILDVRQPHERRRLREARRLKRRARLMGHGCDSTAFHESRRPRAHETHETYEPTKFTKKKTHHRDTETQRRKARTIRRGAAKRRSTAGLGRMREPC